MLSELKVFRYFDKILPTNKFSMSIIIKFTVKFEVNSDWPNSIHWCKARSFYCKTFETFCKLWSWWSEFSMSKIAQPAAQEIKCRNFPLFLPTAISGGVQSVLLRSRKLSTIGTCQNLDGWPPNLLFTLRILLFQNLSTQWPARWR